VTASHPAHLWRRLVFAAGLALMLLLAWRAQSGGDQLNLLARGWLWAERGNFLPYGNPLSNGGKSPGPLTTFLVGLPLFLWRHHRAPIAMVLLFHILAYALLDRVLARIVSARERLLFALVYWLNPWRLFFSGFLWNPSFLCLPAAAHLSSAWASRQRPRFWPSCWHLVAIGAAFQLHPSAIILGLASLFLLWRRSLRIHWPGALAGAALVALSLVPWLAAVAASPAELLPGGEGFPLRGLIYVFPLLRGWLYWLRYASLYVPQASLRLDFFDALGSRLGPAIAPALQRGLGALLPLTVALPLWANRRFLRRPRLRLRRPARSPTRPRAWLREYVLSAGLGATMAFALAPTTVMAWQGIVVLHAAVLPLVVVGGSLARRPTRAHWVRRTGAAWGIASVLLTLILALGSRHYRCHGEQSQGIGLAIVEDHAMFRDLHWGEDCPPAYAPWGVGFWPDVLPRE
jgi:hypothetical protein